MSTVLLLGSGGREDTIAWALSKSNSVTKIGVLPGNPAMKRHPKVECVSGSLKDPNHVVQAAKAFNADLIIIGPEQPIVDGCSDALRTAGFPVAAPSKAAGQLEESKIFSKHFMREFEIPTADFAAYDGHGAAQEGLRAWDFKDGIVVKSDALAGGKGVVLCDTQEEASQVLFDFMQNPNVSVKTQRILFERKLYGQEVSAFAALDGQSVKFIGTACDHKRVFDHDKGPNTGGMGTFSPANWVSPLALERIKEIFQKVADGMVERGHPYQGILFAGLMVDGDEPSVIEFNIRFGDPETQALVPRLKTDLYDLFYATASGGLSDLPPIEAASQSAVHVVLASGGYPSIDGTPINKGHVISFPENLEPDTSIFYAGIKENSAGDYVNSGGRVLGVTALAESRSSARQKAYATVKQIHFDGMHFRTDIGLRHA
ncbi:MAG: phosphoribosylamine--glycine ligase [Myxococcota bacterium]